MYLVRALLGILIGIAIVTIIVAYGGVGINLLMALHRDEVPHGSALLYKIVVCYFLGVVFLLLVTGVYTIAEFGNWKIKNQRTLLYATLGLLLLLVVFHMVA